MLFSCSFDKSVKIWDLRDRSCVGTTVTGSALWAIKSWEKHLVVGGENGVMLLYSVE